jgi:predicted DNA-binding protein (MmcQ/YjbR family)
MITHKELETFLLSLPNARLDKIGDKIFAIVREKSEPVQLSLKCDPTLAVTLRERYESVLPGYHLNKKCWNTLVLTGQLSWDEVKDLINHSYQLVSGTDKS